MTRREDGRWQQSMTVTENGTTRQKYFYGRSKREVLDKIAAWQKQQTNGERFRTIAELWWEEHEPTITVNSVKNYKPAYERAKARFGDSFIRKITPSDVNRFIRDFIKKYEAADKTARTQLMVVNLIFRFAVANGYCDMNVARDISVPKGLPKMPRTVPEDDDIRRVKASVGCTFGLFACLLLYTGLRKGEALALTWRDVDLEAREIRVTKSLYHKANVPMVKCPKTAAGSRTVPIPDCLAAVLPDRKRGVVFPSPAGGYLSETQYQKLWKAYVAESGVTCTPHQLRHCYATMLFEAGIPVKDAQDLLGHAQASTTEDIYTHLREERRKTTAQKLAALDINTDEKAT